MFFKHLRGKFTVHANAESRNIGNLYEESASLYLQEMGFEILDRNVNCKLGELDIVAKNGDSLHFIEVKARRKGSMSEPFESITSQKIKKIRNSALVYLETGKSKIMGLDNCHCHFDVISVKFSDEGCDIEWLKDAFE